MTIYEVSGFQADEAPHWHAAYIEAESPERAKDILQARIGTGEDRNDRPDTVWAVTPRSEWQAAEVKRPFLFILGGGCR